LNPNPSSPTGIVLLNMGGPANLDEVEPFLLNIFNDREIIQLPFHDWLGPYIAKRRTPTVRENYRAIGGGSPILEWTNLQGKGMVERLDKLSPETAPHKFYVAFRYVRPSSKDALLQMEADGVTRAIAFTQYPQWSCSTSGSSFNDLWRAARKLKLERAFRWSVIDRWPTQPRFIEAICESVKIGLEQFSPEEHENVLLMFSAHSLPLEVIDRGDAYPQEIAAGVQAVMERLNFSHEYLLCFQSSIGPVKWMGPSTDDTIRALGAKGRRNVLVVPIAFTSDHIETLSEIDMEYGELAHKVGIKNFKRVPALNGSPIFQDAMAEMVAAHLAKGEICSTQYALRCPGCTNAECRTILNPALPIGHPLVETHFSPETYHKAGRPLRSLKTSE
jgi:protoporphyrin/coproporphyrin ferrochelatase